MRLAARNANGFPIREYRKEERNLNAPTPFDVLTFGETMLRFTPPDFERFGQSRSVEMHVGGSESNTAVGLARLGHHVAWLSRLTDNSLGRWIAREIAAQGVDVSNILWTPNDRVGTYYMERGRPPRDSQVFYDRAASAMSHINMIELPEELFSLGRSRIFHVSGITCGISTSACQTVMRAIQLAKAGGLKISFDMNYRAKLWSSSEAYQACTPILEQADFVFLPVREAVSVCAVSEALPERICSELHARWPQATIVLTQGSLGAIAVDTFGAIFQQAAFLAEEVERLGGGDAFSAGFLSGVLQGLAAAECLRWACACAAIKYTIPGDLPLFEREWVSKLVDGQQPTGIHR